MDASGSPYPTISDPDVATILIWFLMTTMSLAVITRLATKYSVAGKLFGDDLLAVGAMVCIRTEILNGLSDADLGRYWV